MVLKQIINKKSLFNQENNLTIQPKKTKSIFVLLWKSSIVLRDSLAKRRLLSAGKQPVAAKAGLAPVLIEDYGKFRMSKANFRCCFLRTAGHEWHVSQAWNIVRDTDTVFRIKLNFVQCIIVCRWNLVVVSEGHIRCLPSWLRSRPWRAAAGRPRRWRRAVWRRAPAPRAPAGARWPRPPPPRTAAAPSTRGTASGWSRPAASARRSSPTPLETVTIRRVPYTSYGTHRAIQTNG